MLQIISLEKIVMKCKYCTGSCKKNGKQLTGKQKYQCIICKKHQQLTYKYIAYDKEINASITKHVKRGNGIRDIACLLNISPVTVIRKIRLISSTLRSTYESVKKCMYEMDELHTFSGNKKNDQWLIYAINKGTRNIVDLFVGRRNKENIKQIVDKVLLYDPIKIFTDRLNIYPCLIDKAIHSPGRYVTNRIERMNLTFRTHLKRLNRNTLCYSKKADMLEACVKIYLWG
ncbi:MAG: IS1 family transposase [Cytophaga sp.]|uniref:IS1 family transposase n=1 Tax=Cytophaga sp. TaxID=29535 RepID=UPI003F7D6482